MTYLMLIWAFEIYLKFAEIFIGPSPNSNSSQIDLLAGAKIWLRKRNMLTFALDQRLTILSYDPKKEAEYSSETST